MTVLPGTLALEGSSSMDGFGTVIVPSPTPVLGADRQGHNGLLVTVAHVGAAR